MIWARARAGGLSPGWRTPLRTLCGVVGSPTAPAGAVSGANMVSVPWMSHCGPGDVAVAAITGAEAGGAEDGVAGWCGGLFPMLRAVRVRWVVRLRWDPS